MLIVSIDVGYGDMGCEILDIVTLHSMTYTPVGLTTSSRYDMVAPVQYRSKALASRCCNVESALHHSNLLESSMSAKNFGTPKAGRSVHRTRKAIVNRLARRVAKALTR